VRAKKLSIIIVIAIIITFISVNTFSNPVSGQVQPIQEVEEKLQGIADLEEAVLESLFTLSQDIEETERQKNMIADAIEELQESSGKLAEEIGELKNVYDRQLDTLKKVLVSYQRRGPASFLETILKSRNLSEFVQSLNIIRQISRNTDELLSEVEARKNELVLKNEKLLAQEQELENHKARLQETLDEMYRLKEEQEAILNSLGESRDMYQNELQRLQALWDDLKVLFSEILVRFAKIIERGDVSIEALNLKISFPKISGTIYDQTLNGILKDQPELPDMVFTFSQDGILIDIPEKYLSLRGIFRIENKTVLQFEVQEGSFYGMPLTEASLAELFKNGPIVIDFEEILGSVQLESVEVFDGYLEFVILPNF